ncbi:MAG: hypothetical protein IPG10_12990 [Flavobacteriales bacterium]|nr:hypothetical protein [Flavobacteriales bacterium]
MTAAPEIPTSRRVSALVLSIALHGLLLLFLILMKIVTPIPPFPEGGGPGMELGIADLGYSEEGMGDNESMEAPGGGSSAAAASESVSASEELVAEEDGEDMARPTPKPTEKPKTDPTTKPVTKPKEPKISPPTVSNALKEALGGAWNSSGGNGPGSGQGGDGSSNTPGNEGVPGGSPNGYGTFGGGSFNLAGRGIGRAPKITEKPEQSGKVVLTIFVDRSGKVTRTALNLDKSTTTNQTLVQMAKKAALESTFTPKADAAAEQRGEMTFVFILE